MIAMQSDRRAASQRANALKAASMRRKPKIAKVCECCARTFLVHASTAAAAPCRFCSNKCRYESMRGAAGAAAGQRPDLRGANNPNWRGGTSLFAREDRTVLAADARRWRRAVRAKARGQCECCGATAAALDAHHIVAWRDCTDLRFAQDNGAALCPPCHRYIHSPANTGRLFIASVVP